MRSRPSLSWNGTGNSRRAILGRKNETFAARAVPNVHPGGGLWRRPPIQDPVFLEPKTPSMASLRIPALAVVLLAACGDGSEPDDGDLPLTAADLDEHEEARAFLSGGGTVWSEGPDVAELEQLIERLYAAGAKRVLFAGIEEMDDVRISAWLVTELPTGPARAEVFRVFNAAHAEYLGAPAVPDRGQSYLDVGLD